MSVAQEMLHEALPLASVTSGMSPVTIAAATAAVFGGLTTGAFTASKVHTKWHETVDSGYVGVWLDRGQPIERTKWIKQKHLKFLKKRVPLEDIDLAAGESHFEILPPGYYWVPPFKTLQRVATAERTDEIHIQIDSNDKPKQKFDIFAALIWSVDPKGDNPVNFLSLIKNRKEAKKETSDSSFEDELEEQAGRRVAAIGKATLGEALSGYDAETLHKLTFKDEANEEEVAIRSAKVEADTIKAATLELGRLGIVLDGVRLFPLVRAAEEVQRQGLDNSKDSRRGIILDPIPADENGMGRVLPFPPRNDAA